jgi:hypothetical protein
MGRTELRDLKTITSEPTVGKATPSMRTKWRSPPSACHGVLEKGLTPPTVSQTRFYANHPFTEHRMFLTPSKGRFGGQQILTLSQASNREPDDVNHTEPEFFLQAVDEMKVRVRKANSRRLEFLVLHNPSFLQPCGCPGAMRQRGDSCLVSRRYRFAKNFSEHDITIAKMM